MDTIYTHILTLIGYGVLISEGILRGVGAQTLKHPALHPDVYSILIFLSGILMINRLLQRLRCTHLVYGWGVALLAPVRWPVGVFINSLALLRAAQQVLLNRFGLKKLSWSKTQHEAPQEFVHS